MSQYDFDTLKQAILFNTVEVLPTDEKQLDEEIQRLVDLANSSGEPIRHYIGFEISGRIHIGTGIASALKIKKLQDAGVECNIFLADYHTYLNNKLDGTFETIRQVAKEYFGPVMLKCCEIVGCDTSKINLVLAQDLYEQKRNNQSYFTYVLKVAKELTLSRVVKSVSVMGKDAGDGVDFGTLEYPVMQVSDAFFMQTHIVHAGIDQRKCHVLMRETALKLPENFALKINNNQVKPLATHHKLLLSLEPPKDTQNSEISKEEVNKMSKSRPDSAVFVEDTPEEITRKLKKAYCPMPNLAEQSPERVQEEQEWNPILDWCEHMIYPAGKKVRVSRKPEWGGDRTYESFAELQMDYFVGKLHPMDLKAGVAECLSDWFAPIREYVDKNSQALQLVIDAKRK